MNHSLEGGNLMEPAPFAECDKNGVQDGNGSPRFPGRDNKIL